MSPAPCFRKWLVLIGLFSAIPALVFAQASVAPLGGEYAVSGPLNGDQTAPAIAINSSGGFAVWQDNGIDGKGLGIAGRRLDANLSPVGSAFRVNQIVAGDQEKPSAALLSAGGAVVVWQGGRLGFQEVFARFLGADGSFLTSEVQVSPLAISGTVRVTTNWMVMRNNRLRARTQRIKQIVDEKHERTGGASVATLADGTIVVAYGSGRKSNVQRQVLAERVRKIGKRFVTNSVLEYVTTASDSMQDVYFQRFSATGQKIAGETRANQFLDFNQRSPSIAALKDGTFVLAWISEQQRGETNIDVVARLFDANGAALGDEFIVNTSTRPSSSPAVAASSGGFTIVWTEKDRPRENSLDIYARAFSSSAVPITTGFVVNNHTRGDQFSPAIASSAAGQFVVWTSLGQDGSREGIYGRRLKDGSIVGNEFRINTTTLLRQFHPAVAADTSGRAAVIWSSYQTEAAFDLFGQRYAAP
jgi:hypothetical protein